MHFEVKKADYLVTRESRDLLLQHYPPANQPNGDMNMPKFHCLGTQPGVACLNADACLLAIALEHDIHLYRISDFSL